MKIMANHTSATAHEEAPHVLETSRTNTIINALRRRVQAVLNDESLDPQSRAILRYGLETNDPWLARLVRQADARESIVDAFDVSQPSEPNEHHSNREKIEALAEIICAAGEESSAALLVLMGMIQNSAEPTAVENTAKHLAFTRCGELNFRGMVDAQLVVIGDELLFR
jgi:hypothetical protein